MEGNGKFSNQQRGEAKAWYPNISYVIGIMAKRKEWKIEQ